MVLFREQFPGSSLAKCSRRRMHERVGKPANPALVFLLLNAATGALWRSALVAALFAVHPLHVESVAWVSERKDVLSVLFGLLTLYAYGRYVAGPCWQRYLPLAIGQVLSL